MKVVVIGIGQCGCNIADQFAVTNSYASSFFGRRIKIVTDILAINTDETDLRSFKHIPGKKRLLIGTTKTRGHGVGKVNVDAAQIFKDNHFMLAEEILKSRKFFEADAVAVVASGGGGTGSGGIGQMLKVLKERLRCSIFAILVLPFAYEESGAVSYALTNTATCLTTIDKYASATFLLDNERFSRGPTVSMANSFHQINSAMSGNFYVLFCAGEEKVSKYIGSKVMDAGDIINSLVGISVIGRGKVTLPTFRFRKETLDEGVQRAMSISMALTQAIGNLTTDINLKDARKLLALLCAPKDFITQPALQEIYSRLLEEAPKAEIRIGDYPRRKREVSLTLIASELVRIPRIEKLYSNALTVLKSQKVTKAEARNLIKQRKGKAKRIPTLA